MTLDTDTLNYYLNETSDAFEDMLSRAVDMWNTGYPRSQIVEALQTEFHLEPYNASRIELIAETLTHDVKKKYGIALVSRGKIK